MDQIYQLNGLPRVIFPTNIEVDAEDYMEDIQFTLRDGNPPETDDEAVFMSPADDAQKRKREQSSEERDDSAGKQPRQEQEEQEEQPITTRGSDSTVKPSEIGDDNWIKKPSGTRPKETKFAMNAPRTQQQQQQTQPRPQRELSRRERAREENDKLRQINFRIIFAERYKMTSTGLRKPQELTDLFLKGKLRLDNRSEFSEREITERIQRLHREGLLDYNVCRYTIHPDERASRTSKSST